MIHLNIYQESTEQVINTVSRLKAIRYKNIKVRFDGTYNDSLSIWLLNNGVNVTHCQRLKAKDNGGLITHCYLNYFVLNSKDNYLIKIDPDTTPYYPLNNIPEDKVGCNYNASNEHIYGGCIAFPKNIARQIVTSGLLLERKYQDNKWNYKNHKLKGELSCQDMIIYNVLERLEIGIDSMDDQIFSRNERDSVKPSKEYCFVHVSPICQ